LNIKLAYRLFQNMGIRYTSYRIQHEVENRMGVLKKKHPINPEKKCFVSLQDWRKANISFVIKEQESISFFKNADKSLKDAAHKILNGEICFFSSEWKDLGLNYDWITNPETAYKYDVSKHWSEINDFNPANGDIKYVWEKSRFTYFLTIMRHDYHFDEDHSEFIFSEMESWINANPINQGPNWKCSQEISLRLFNWMYALTFYKNSDALSEELWTKIQNIIYWSLHHVYHHINFSRIAVRNNHAITETLALTISELLFPFIPETKKWAKKGRKWFEQEVEYQIYEDGTFLQFSMNYHRVVVQLFSFGIALTELHNKKFSTIVYDRAAKSLDFLYQCLQEENGYLPNYGSNDGAVFFPLSSAEYRDYRPQLNTLHFVLYNQHLFNSKNSREDSCWIKQKSKSIPNSNEIIQKKVGVISYPKGGYYLIRESDTFTFIRCGNYKDRPYQADNLHLDIWSNGVNLLRDSGTYKYNTEKKYQDYFMGTASHNTVMVENHSQMLKGSRFIWYYWTQSLLAGLTETDTEFIFKGKIAAFQFLRSDAFHKRTVIKKKNSKEWVVKDEVNGLNNFDKIQIWHHDESPVKFQALEGNIEAVGNEFESYDSSYYGIMRKGRATAFKFDTEIRTKITIT